MFASNKTRADEPFVVPRRLLAGNLRLCGVLLSYAPEEAIPAMKQGMGWNFCPTALGASILAFARAYSWVSRALRPTLDGEPTGLACASAEPGAQPSSSSSRALTSRGRATVASE